MELSLLRERKKDGKKEREGRQWTQWTDGVKADMGTDNAWVLAAAIFLIGFFVGLVSVGAARRMLPVARAGRRAPLLAPYEYR